MANSLNRSRVERERESLHPIEASELHARRERVFLVLAGLFLGTLAMLNILGISRFIAIASLDQTASGWTWTWGQFSSAGGWTFAVAVGVLPYPITFLCTDLISEFYGRRRANWVVTVGLFLNAWVIFILWIGGTLPPHGSMSDNHMPQINVTQDMTAEALEQELKNTAYPFYFIRQLAFGAVIASMMAYLAAQFCDVYLFHFWKKVTKGRHLWLRNNGSTLVSQMVDTVAVILITHYFAHALPVNQSLPILPQLMTFILTGYAFKAVFALLDTVPFYLVTRWLTVYLEFDPVAEWENDI